MVGLDAGAGLAPHHVVILHHIEQRLAVMAGDVLPAGLEFPRGLKLIGLAVFFDGRAGQRAKIGRAAGGQAKTDRQGGDC